MCIPGVGHDLLGKKAQSLLQNWEGQVSHVFPLLCMLFHCFSTSLSSIPGAEPSPALLVPSTKRRSRKSSKDAGEGKEGATLGSEEPASKGKGRGRKPSIKAKAGRLSPLLGLELREPLHSEDPRASAGSL